MPDWLLAATLLLGCPAAWWLTGRIRRHALARGVLDLPNPRSSHTEPTPRGGGLAIVAVVLAGLPLLWWQGELPARVVVAIAGSGALIAWVGWRDDQRHVAVHWRLAAHLLAAAWGLAWLGGLPPLEIAGRTLEPGWVGTVLGVLYLTWLLNLYNFMDGIDGIAAVEAVTVAAGGALVLWLAAPQAGWYVPLLPAAAAAGFLAWNFPRARIFMGDGGSGFLGLLFGLLSLQAGWLAPELAWAWLILLGVFVVDASWTLLRRLTRGESLHQAHRGHAYQVAARRVGSHVPVTAAVALVNLAWLWPLAALVATGRVSGPAGLALAYAPLLAAAAALSGRAAP
ncbi:MAG: glycosyl transferase [Gammaproteobacteria bacterium]